MIRKVLCVAAAAALPTLPGTAGAQDLDVEGWTGLVQMPVAVARLDVAGVPLAELGLLIPALNVRDVPPERFIETARGIPVIWRDDSDGGTGGEGVGDFVQAMHARGLRGRELADAIHAELGRRGVPAGPKDERGRVRVLDGDWLPRGHVDPRFRDDPFLAPDRARPGDAGGAGAGRPDRVFRDALGRRGRGGGPPAAGAGGSDERGEAGKSGGPPGGKARGGGGKAGGKSGGKGGAPGSGAGGGGERR